MKAEKQMTVQSHHAEDLDEHSVNRSVDGVVARHGASATHRDVCRANTGCLNCDATKMLQMTPVGRHRCRFQLFTFEDKKKARVMSSEEDRAVFTDVEQLYSKLRELQSLKGFSQQWHAK